MLAGGFCRSEGEPEGGLRGESPRGVRGSPQKRLIEAVGSGLVETSEQVSNVTCMEEWPSRA